MYKNKIEAGIYGFLGAVLFIGAIKHFEDAKIKAKKEKQE